MTRNRSAAAKLGWERRRARLLAEEKALQKRKRKDFLWFCRLYGLVSTRLSSIYSYHFQKKRIEAEPAVSLALEGMPSVRRR